MAPSDLDPFEERMRETLHSPAAEPVDVEDILADIHRGARGRRTHRVVAGTAATILLLAGGGYAVSTSGLLGSEEPDTVVADPDLTEDPSATPSSAPPTSTTISSSAPTVISNDQAVSDGATDTLSLTSTGTAAQWALAATPIADCPVDDCLTVFANPVTTDNWAPLGQLPLPAGVDGEFASGVTQLRVSGSIDAKYDGWAYGGALLSTHQKDDQDVGLSWAAPRLPVPGDVTALEARGDTVYALVVGRSTTLVTSPTRRDEWQVVDTGLELGQVSNLTMSQGIVAFLNDAGGSTRLVASRDGGPWVSTQPCESGTPVQVSTAQDSLWVLCSDANTSTVRVSPDDPSTWTSIGGSYDYPALLAASSATTAVLAEPGGLSRISDAATTPLSDVDYTSATFFGFTNPQVGFLIDSGEIVATDDGGDSWTPVDLTP